MARRIYNKGNTFLQKRHRAYTRHLCQCRYRREEFDLTLQDWSDFWPDAKTWSQRGRSVNSLCMTRIDPEKPWSRSNCCLLTRENQLKIKNARISGRDTTKYFLLARTL